MPASYDVIILGYGAAGAAAALQAAQSGAKVLVVEKSSTGGGNSYVSSANMTCPQDFDAAMEKDGAAHFTDYLEESTQYTTPRATVAAFTKGLHELEPWLKELGGELEDSNYDKMHSYYIPPMTFPNLESAQGLKLTVRHLKQTKLSPADTGGRRIWELLHHHIKDNPNITLSFSSRCKRILKDHNGCVNGVLLQNDEFIPAPAVIMACGGFENDIDLRRDLMGPREFGLLGTPHNNGDGFRLAQHVGARLWHASAEATVLGLLPPGEECGFALGVRKPGFIYVNRTGRRFVDETKIESHRGHIETGAQDPYSGKSAHDPIWMISDKENLLDPDKPPIVDFFSYQVVVNGYQWSKHSEEEIKKGWIVVADTLGDLARKLDLQELPTTVKEWNDQCQNPPQLDETLATTLDPLRRDQQTRVPLKGPFCAMKIVPLLYNTQGGPRRNEKAQILSIDGPPIEGLYGAGELGSIWGHVYQSSTNFAETIVFGRIAAKEAAALAESRRKLPLR
ncbi:hypothetical protein PMZ80_002546 [Knufia obscura]|uniref:Apoptosis regulator Bcl-2 family BH4 domain-containing protein n=2 Tax=Knufia TaxID=430999 RepID=A0AAN8ENK6_9EURO|nr:hypothetical protein PMZ80_002546 [Knufia obscura]KAK5950746.1 hypothetical protein OHC33_008129 [Knufia fluminis]